MTENKTENKTENMTENKAPNENELLLAQIASLGQLLADAQLPGSRSAEVAQALSFLSKLYEATQLKIENDATEAFKKQQILEQIQKDSVTVSVSEWVKVGVLAAPNDQSEPRAAE